MLDFEFKQSDLRVTTDDLDKAHERSENGSSKYLEEGVHEVRITEAAYVVDDAGKPIMSEKDPSWGKLKLTFADASDRTIRSTYLIPTKGLLYGTSDEEAKDPKKKNNGMFPYMQLQRLFAGIGELLNADAKVINAVKKKYLANPKALVGKELTIEVGFTKPHIVYVDKDVYKVVKLDGTELFVGETFKSREMAILAASNANLKIDTFPSIVKIHSKIKDKAEESAPAEEASQPVNKDDKW